MDTLAALDHLRNNPNNVPFMTYEWSLAGLWESAEKILAAPRDKLWTAAEIDALIVEANNN